MQKLLTIVVPVYKVEAYINKCLDSLVIDPELMEKMDVLIINDGTPDNSAIMSREYVKRYPNTFRQIDKDNGGHGSVWNLGVKEAYGKYTKFLDSDDWLENLDIMIRKLEGTDADLVITSCIAHCPGNELWKLEIKDMEFDRVYDADRFDWLGNRSHGNYIFHHCAIYKTEMFRQYLPLFLEKQPYDDVILGAASIIGAKTLVAWDLEVYQYLMDREGQSISLEVQRRNIHASNFPDFTVLGIEPFWTFFHIGTQSDILKSGIIGSRERIRRCAPVGSGSIVLCLSRFIGWSIVDSRKRSRYTRSFNGNHARYV